MTRALRSTLIGMAIALFTVAYAAMAGDSEGAQLHVYNWADYIGETTLADFEQKYGIEVNYDVYDSAEMVDAKLLAGSSGYDVVVHAASNAVRLIPAGIFRKLDKDKLTNWDNLDPALLEKFAQYDPGNRYGVPYMWGTTGFSYNRDMVLERMPDAPVNSAALVFDPDIVSKFADCGVTLLDNAGEVIGMAMRYLGHKSNSVNPAHLEEVENLLRSIRPHIKYFSSGKSLLDLPSKEVCIAMNWSGDYSIANRRAENAGIDIDLRFNIPKEGALIWFDVAYIPADATNVDNAHRFLNYLLRPEVIANITNYTGYANANLTANDLIDPEIASDQAIYPDKKTLRRLSPNKALPPKRERLRSRVWTRIKSGL